MKAMIRCESVVTWQQAAEKFIRNVMKEYYLAAPALRSSLYMLKLIESYRSLLSAQLFESLGHYYMILAKITDHLLQFCVSREEAIRSPFLLFTQATYFHRKTRKKTNINIDMAYQEDDGTYTIRKILLADRENMIRNYTKMAPAACQQTFGFYPKRIEFCFLFTGKRAIEVIPAP
jgi:hypothetical protein